MLANQFSVELKRAFTWKRVLLWLSIIFLLPLLRFFMIKDGYQFFEKQEVFQEMVSAIIPLVFPVLIIMVYLPSFLHEKRNNFITYTRTRVEVSKYLLSKGMVNALLTGAVVFFMMLFAFIFAFYIEPAIGMIYYYPMDEYSVVREVTFSELLTYGELFYGIVYAIWVAVNAVIYSTIAFLLLLVVNNAFVALSVPFLFYHVFNFITGVFDVPMFSPLSTLFPFNIVAQPIWTVFVPFFVLIFGLAATSIYIMRNRKEWMI
ncbi:ABC transporter permease [Thalassobacillus devorans]|uniref:ABC transporter permease n=1 Tax=Thalassobacillus devorans TaxID=279813 RepID=UPI000A1CDD5E|nr:ABC transporter permease [Thalassobacillus devorans]